MDAAEFQARTGVSRETRERLEAYAALLRRWQVRINLVARSTLDDLWHRHMLDSAQLFPLLPEGTQVLVDLGSGAGFPGLVLAILDVPEVHLIESDSRKAAFLGEVSRETAVPVIVHAERIERVPPFPADVVTARALAPLPVLLPLAARFAGPHTVGLFPKGQHVGKELTEATKNRKLRLDAIPSITDPSATILRIGGLGLA